ncbi:hypothetical protein Tco_0695282 [Tanacetum coccineum]
MGTPHVVATFLALGDITYPLKLGFCMYWHKHGFCSIIFAQHNCEGSNEADDIAPAHGASSVGTHVTAVVTCDPTNNISTIVVAQIVMYANDFIENVECKVGRIMVKSCIVDGQLSGLFIEEKVRRRD